MKKCILIIVLLFSGINSLNADMCRWHPHNQANRHHYLRCVSKGKLSATQCCQKLGGEWLREVR